jgi:hypothetical protein
MPTKSNKSNKLALRPSPSNSATEFPVNTIRLGNDGNDWIIVKNINGVKKWNKFKIETIDHVKYFKNAFNELSEHGIITFNKPMGDYFVDYAWEDVENELKKQKYHKMAKDLWNETDPDNYPVIFYMKPSDRPLSIFLRHNLPQKKQKQIATKILKKHFGNNFSWNGISASAIEIKTGLKPLPKPKGRKKKEDYGSNYNDDTKEKMHGWLIEFPNAKFKKIGKYERWTSPEIEVLMDEFKKIKNELKKYGTAGKNSAENYANEILPLTPWISPSQAADEMDDVLGYAKDVLAELKGEPVKRKKRKLRRRTIKRSKIKKKIKKK